MVAVSPPPSSPLVSIDRVHAARAVADELGIDVVVVTPGSDLRYLCGYDAHAMERLTALAVPRRGEPLLVVPRLEAPMIVASPAGSLGLEVLAWDETDDSFARLAEAVTARLGKAPARVAVGSRTWAEHALGIQRALPGSALELASPVIDRLRMVKTPAEIEELAIAGSAIDRVHARMGEWLRVGRTEAEVGADVAAAILAEGHVGVDFTIIGSGPNGASPHHEVSDRVVEAGDVVVVDIGGETATGYRSDCTRTYLVGGYAARGLVEWFSVLQRAQAAAVAAVRPGVTCAQVDAVARDVITKAGFGEHFIHRTGHGIGLDTHEAPYVVAGNDLPLEPGMAFSVEPGIYLPGRYGARIEDIVVCTDDGVRNLNNGPRELVELPG
ncbi:MULTISPECIES: M24 family metallopeptidase [unclassified Modestobacter]|uniref:M24 family metallopeptidase n=1 Tax=unclassified Modestobacter TaxID=2643866 RepID=UPI0022AA22DB|nr:MULTISPECIES: Xaa-Pro peptidase family protein [unclassified Modestobacter]MCZ2825939.1 Xaa-Pro peptidase family protein [Modestobacter sp. VKM Ac-2981]MCZ2852996.1 Xaa-Pro peptidase family protein [Modestobacter sp. VKM Ac-2982]